MAEVIASAVVTVLIEKLFSHDLMNFARSEGIDSQLKKWKKMLPLIKAVLAEAGQKHVTQRAVELWQLELQDLAYDIDDVLDDMSTEAMKRKLNQASHASTSSSKLSKIIPTCCTNFTPHNMMFGRKISSRLDEITSKLHDLVDMKNNLGLNVNVKVERSSKTDVGLQQNSLVDVSNIFGLEWDTYALLGKLLRDEGAWRGNQDVRIVSIVGMGGIGKTTLARLLYNDRWVKDHFELKAWVCVSDDFDLFNIFKAIYQTVSGKDKTFANPDLLCVDLQNLLAHKRFLIVLDDVWNEDPKYWDLFKSPFVMGEPGSRILVTTRNTNVALAMNSVETHNMKVLSDESALSLLAQYALDEHNFDSNPSRKLIAQGIVKKCGGLPLALKTLGRALKTKGNNDEWEKLLNSEIWNIHNGNDILQSLKRSYYDLPPHLKQLFAYCSLLPKDYLFNKNKLVLLWTAEGFLSQLNRDTSMESLGRQYFEELQYRSCFQQSTNHESLYTMHVLMNDLAVSVARMFFFMLDDKKDINGKNEGFEMFRYFSFIGQQDEVFKKFKELQRATCLRTFLRVPTGLQVVRTVDNEHVDLLSQLQLLRVISLTEYDITEVPPSIGSLKHLRYLNFSGTRIKQLPEQLSNLYNLQSLLLCHCHELSSLPSSLGKLINLRHLDIDDTPSLKKTPIWIVRLMSLQTLSKVYIEGGNGFKISDIKGLLDLQGQLSIKGLEKVIDPRQAKDANLQQKKGLDDLDMEWSHVFDDFRNSIIEHEVLETLLPQCKLKQLRISFYGGMKFPSWVGDPSYDHLTDLTLRGCKNCTQLPTLGLLTSLRKLCVSSMDGVKTVGFQLLAPTKSFSGITFPSLECLEICDMQNLEIWSTSNGDNVAESFPSLRLIQIERCPKLVEVSIGLIPSLTSLDIKGCSEAVLRALVSVSSTILRLTMYDIIGLAQLGGEVLKHLEYVEYLDIQCCDRLTYLWESESEACKFLLSLQKMHIEGCKKLVSMGENEVDAGNMGSVREVTLKDCETLESYNCPFSVEKLVIKACSSMTSLAFSTLQELPHSLKILDVRNCLNLKSFPHEHLQSLTSLEELSMWDCPRMEDSFPSGFWPPNLRSLMIGCLNKPMSKWGLQSYPTSLVELSLYGENSGVVSFEMEEDMSNDTASSFLLPPSLTSLRISNFMDVESLSEVLQYLPRLEQLIIDSCPKLRDVPDTTSYLRVEVY